MAGRQQHCQIRLSYQPHRHFRQLPAEFSAQQSMLSSLDRQLPSEAQHACEGPEQGITLDELQAALKMSCRGKKPGLDDLP